ncbi:MAG TPA: ABC transporter ATP-binding protein [Chthoniobacter sp.]|jgi:phospholipid/cholesterol/gamma-HCH transport system ATP-binding protein
MISVRNLVKTLGDQEVLRGVDLEVQNGETCVVMGRSGGGKSVLIKHFIGLFKPTSGEVWVDGEEITKLEERKLGSLRKKIGMLFQSGALFDSMNVEENIAFPLREAGVKDPEEIRDRVAEALEMVDLAGEQKKMPENLSGGMRKRVGLARTIVSRPSCVLYDEPTTGLDPIATDSINHLIRRLQKRLSVTSVVVTHDLKTAFHTADRIAFLHEGRIYFHGLPAELRASQDQTLVNFVEGHSGESD